LSSTRIVNQYINPTSFFYNGLDHALHLVGIGNVAGNVFMLFWLSLSAMDAVFFEVGCRAGQRDLTTTLLASKSNHRPMPNPAPVTSTR
jgi:hypothetical protein